MEDPLDLTQEKKKHCKITTKILRNEKCMQNRKFIIKNTECGLQNTRNRLQNEKKETKQNA